MQMFEDVVTVHCKPEWISYSRVQNKRPGMFINFWKKFTPLLPGLEVRNFLLCRKTRDLGEYARVILITSTVTLLILLKRGVDQRSFSYTPGLS